MEDLIRLAYMFFHWRVLLCVGATAFATVQLAKWGSWFSAPQAIALVLTSFFAGIAWNASAWASPATELTPKLPRSTSIHVAVISSAVGGAIWGLLSRHSIGAALFGLALLLIVSAVLYAWRSSRHNQRVPRSYALSCLPVAVCSFAAFAIYEAEWLSRP